jgi:hypothetical protein
MSTQTENRRFNRVEIPGADSAYSLISGEHLYYAGRGFIGLGEVEYKGLVKCRLAHGPDYSILIPDFIFLGEDGRRWIQPLAFFAALLAKLDHDHIECSMRVDVSCGHTLRLRFRNTDFVQKFPDGSELYQCSIFGPEELESYATGESELRAGNIPFVRLYHHTQPQYKEGILRSGSFRLSAWNIQGSKKLTNVGYVYFTPLNAITADHDLTQIAMASRGIVHLIVDHFPIPPFMRRVEDFDGFILPLRVYRESTKNRTATLSFMVDTTALATQHVLRHESSTMTVFYEVCSPFIQRLGLPIGGALRFIGSDISPAVADRKRFGYAVVGDARMVSGLAAPYDEENTSHILKIEFVPDGSTVLEFWFGYSNRDLFSNKDVEMLEFMPG